MKHDELQVVAFANKLAGFEGAGMPLPGLTLLLPERPFDYNTPQKASGSLVLVKQLPGGNTFNHKRPSL